jgi:two-component system OmpR family response regulator
MKQSIRVIYVDDDPKTTVLLPQALALAGIEVLAICASAEELLAMKDTEMYEKAEAFVIDVRLPEMTGVELAGKLRAEGERRPILAVSAWPKEAGWELAEMKVVYLQKPYEFEELERTIRRLVEESEAA